jgi:hypothetical protein
MPCTYALQDRTGRGQQILPQAVKEENWDNDPCTMTGADGKLLLLVGVEEDLLGSAQAVVRLVYEEMVPTGLDPSGIAKVGTLASMVVLS